MNDREVMQALLDGMTLVCNLGPGFGYFRMENDTIWFRGASEKWSDCGLSSLKSFKDLRVLDEYPLAFFEAVDAISKGSMVESETTWNRFALDESGKIVRTYEGMTGPIDAKFNEDEINGRWRVVR